MDRRHLSSHQKDGTNATATAKKRASVGTSGTTRTAPSQNTPKPKPKGKKPPSKRTDKRAPAQHSRSFEKDVTAQSLAAGLMHRTGTEVIGQRFGNLGETLTERDADRGERFRKLPLLEFCRNALRLEGREVPLDRHEMVRASFSLMSFASIFSPTVHGRLLQAYEEAEDTTGWCMEEDVTNFGLQERASLGKAGNMQKLPKGGEAQQATIGDDVETYRVARYANQFVMDEEHILDDNFDGLEQIPDELGLGAARLRPDLVYSVLLANPAMQADGLALFHASHGNIATTPLSIAGLQAAVTRMKRQTQNGVRVNLQPTHLLVPGDLEFLAKEIVLSEKLIVSGTTDIARAERNTLRDLNLVPVVEGRLDANGVTDPDSGVAYTGSATNWLLVGAGGRTLVVGYLNGTGRKPRVRSHVLDRGQWGIAWDVSLDIGVKALDYRPFQRGNI